VQQQKRIFLWADNPSIIQISSKAEGSSPSPVPHPTQAPPLPSPVPLSTKKDVKRKHKKVEEEYLPNPFLKTKED
jgi:hypothetical protein